MTTQLSYRIAHQRHSELAEQARLAGEARPAASASSPSSAAATESSFVLADGTRISLRQVGAGDRAGMAALFARLTPESRHRRFLSPKRELTAGELTFFTDIDHLNHEAVAAVDQRDGAIVGVARYVRHGDRADVAEVAIEVADAFQMMGIGTALARLTIQYAHANGLKLLTATTLWENRAARRLLRQHGFRARQSHGGEIEYELTLDEPGLATVKTAPTSAVSHAHAVDDSDRLATTSRLARRRCCKCQPITLTHHRRQLPWFAVETRHATARTQRGCPGRRPPGPGHT